MGSNEAADRGRSDKRQVNAKKTSLKLGSACMHTDHHENPSSCACTDAPPADEHAMYELAGDKGALAWRLQMFSGHATSSS